MSHYPAIGMYIGGRWIERGDEDIVNPSDESRLGGVPHATSAELDEALASAADAFRSWRKLAPEKRHAIMAKAVELLRARADGIARAISLEQGKPFAQARAEVLRGSDLLLWDAEEGRRAYGRAIPSGYGYRNIAVREPIGPVAAFTPWSAPASAPLRKIGAALAAGCSIVLKASEETPAGAVWVVRCFEDAGLPAGVLNLVFGVPADISRHLIASPVSRLVTFTGSVPVGILLAKLAAEQMKPAVMELGGHAPVFVCEDADVGKVAVLAAAAKFRNAGQVCISPTRFFVHESIERQFREAFASAAAEVRVGGGAEPGAEMGPVANGRRLQAMKAMVEDAVSRGGKIATGGRQVERRGYFFEPTVLYGLPAACEVLKSEPFGPIATVQPYQSLEEAVVEANRLEYGLAAYAFSDSASRLDYLNTHLEVGHIAINHFGGGVPESPFGGVKHSGLGREGGIEGLEGYLVTKYITHKISL